MNPFMLKCSNCGELIEEPSTTYGLDCPKCGTYLLVPSRKDWELLKKLSKIKS